MQFLQILKAQGRLVTPHFLFLRTKLSRNLRWLGLRLYRPRKKLLPPKSLTKIQWQSEIIQSNQFRTITVTKPRMIWILHLNSVSLLDYFCWNPRQVIGFKQLYWRWRGGTIYIPVEQIKVKTSVSEAGISPGKISRASNDCLGPQSDQNRSWLLNTNNSKWRLGRKEN